ncbi:dTDP-4-dehydrorhamnose 3,5-epimerase [Cyclobacterium sp. 1_MG-2023]|uniref:dTDP-4-dehydrorhamnose 3,5-epimerase n=1 Tax=Cyclobacterium sp. 1_MG-2023 TaxID=3062681 RepID=UPI0026E3B913|nr:dTDP-4-dehydrorhamnose 3,5-epimerase [Cyclobacterium sp. 1_MG-2023]MDO6439802.1 dTDP-4-dehydrorhamnose 3,5-epimerase [Cyclobacterium sp. 1_MG-2023]
MIFTETKLKGAYIIDVKKIEDERGYFGRVFCKNEFDEVGIESNIAQTNMSFNPKKGTLRGMHYQVTPYEETKLVKCTSGAIFDCIVDLRKDSPTYLEWIGVELTEENNRMLFVPRDFAHGFITLKDNTAIQYFVSQFYAPGAEKGIKWDDPKINIQWPIDVAVISEKDNNHPYLNDQFL